MGSQLLIARVTQTIAVSAAMRYRKFFIMMSLCVVNYE